MAGHEMTEPETPARVLVILPAQDVTLSEILTQLEAGKIVLILPPPNADIKAKPKQDRS
jgi:hypothetical protein